VCRLKAWKGFENLLPMFNGVNRVVRSERCRQGGRCREAKMRQNRKKKAQRSRLLTKHNNLFNTKGFF